MNGSVDPKAQEGDAAGKKVATNRALAESSMSNSATGLTDNKPSLIPSLHFMEPASTTVQQSTADARGAADTLH